MHVTLLMISAFFTLLFASSNSLAQATPPMTFALDSGQNTVRASGQIASTTADEFRAFLKIHDKLGKNWPVTVNLTSNGGIIGSAIEVGKLLRAHQMNVNVDGICASACAYMMLGGVNRTVGTSAQIGVHQFFRQAATDDPNKQQFTGEDLAIQQRILGNLHQYISDMGADSGLVALAAKTPAERMHFLSPTEISAFRVVSGVSSPPQAAALVVPIAPPVAIPTVPQVAVDLPLPKKTEIRPTDLAGFARADEQFRRAAAEVERTRNQRFAGTCRTNGPKINSITGRGTSYASGQGTYDMTGAIEECGRESLIDDSVVSIQRYQACVLSSQNHNKFSNLYDANCKTGYFLKNNRKFQLYFPKKPTNGRIDFVTINGLHVRIKDLDRNEFLGDYCASGLDYHAKDYMALCDMSPQGRAQWERFERR